LRSIAQTVERSTRLIKNATSLGGTETTMESRHRWEGDRVPVNLIRLSVGLEDADERRGEPAADGRADRSLARREGTRRQGPDEEEEDVGADPEREAHEEGREPGTVGAC
jgi:hypothetical protein